MSGVSYLSSNGIALLVRYHRQMRQIGGRFRIVADSEAVGHVLRLTGVCADAPRRRADRRRGGAAPAAACEAIERDGDDAAGLPEGDRRPASRASS